MRKLLSLMVLAFAVGAVAWAAPDPGGGTVQSSGAALVQSHGDYQYASLELSATAYPAPELGFGPAVSTRDRQTLFYETLTVSLAVVVLAAIVALCITMFLTQDDNKNNYATLYGKMKAGRYVLKRRLHGTPGTV